MPRRFRLFVSAGPDLEPEREVIGRVVAQLPVQLGWEIKRTPPPGESRQTDTEAIANCDLFLLLMGQDIVAPVGVEWDVARRSGRAVVPLLRKGAHTPAAAIFLRETHLSWQPFETLAELEQLVREALVNTLLERATDFVLTPEEWEALQQLQKEDTADEELESEPAGAGGGGVILGPEDVASAGVIVGEE